MIRSILAGIYGCFVKIRLNLYKTGLKQSRKLNTPVISIGNLALGGTGKTPFTIYLCQILLTAGLKPAVLSRGYRGTAEKLNLLVSNGKEKLCTPAESGDEPWLMADSLPGVPVAVGGKRYKSAGLCHSDHSIAPDIFVLDDGFQHIQLQRDIDIVLIDATSPFGGEYIVPKGILREPLSSLERADAYIVTRSHLADENEKRETIASRLNGYSPSAPVFFYCHKLTGFRQVSGTECSDGSSASFTKNPPGRSTFILAAIGNPLQFIRDLENQGLDISGQVLMRDHHPFSQQELNGVIEEFKDSGAEFIVTTEKDAVRLRALDLKGVPLYSAGLEVYSSDETKFRTWLMESLSDLVSARQEKP